MRDRLSVVYIFIGGMYTYLGVIPNVFTGTGVVRTNCRRKMSKKHCRSRKTSTIVL